MEKQNLEMLELKKQLAYELQNVENKIYTYTYNRLSDWDKGYLQGKELGLKLALQGINYLSLKGEY